MQKNTQQKQTRQGINNTTAGVMGAAVGGIVGAAAAVALSDKEKRKLLLHKMEDLKTYVAKALDEISQMSEGFTDGVSEPTVTPKTRKHTKKRQVN